VASVKRGAAKEHCAMTEESRPPHNQPYRQQVRIKAGPLGSAVLSSGVRDRVVHPDAAPLHQIPKDDDVQKSLSKIENLLGRGDYGAALKESATLAIPSSPLAGHYEFTRHEKISRAHAGIADRYLLRGELDQATTFYQRALVVDTDDATVKRIADAAVSAFDTLLNRRAQLIQALGAGIQKDSFDEWCGQKRELGDVTVLDVREIRSNVIADFQLERVFGELPPVVSETRFFQPLAPESESVDSASALPGSVFRSVTEGAVDVDLLHVTSPNAAADNRIRASVAMPLIGQIFRAKLGLFAVEASLNVAGQATGSVPLFRYEYLRDKAKQTISQIQKIESRMLPIQFELDDFAEVVDAIRRPLAQLQAELEAVKQRIDALVTQLAALAQAKKAVDATIIAFDPIVDKCECDWFCWLLDVLIIAVDVAVVVAIIALGAEAIAALDVISVTNVLEFLGLTTLGAVLGDVAILFTAGVFSCEHVGGVIERLKTTQQGLQQSINDNNAELTHALAVRDILIARINALQDELSEVYQSNAARLLDAKTLDLIQAQYNSLRQSLLTRAQAVAAFAQDAFNFERDTDLHLIRDSYFDKDRKDYTAAETLLRDLDGLDYIDITGRTQKAVQLSHTVSLRRHYSISLLTLQLTGSARFVTELKEFDRWFPGTHQQRIKEIKVEVLIEGKPRPVRGYLSNDGVSMVRFQDTGNKRLIDNVHVFAEPDEDIAKLCYKRFQRRRHVDTMAFPDFSSYLHEERMRRLQDKERNVFENVGLESSWIIQLLPDQASDLSKVSDVLIHFQYEAQFDDNLKRILEKKRYTGRQEASTISIKQTLAEQGRTVDFTGPVSFRAPLHRFEAPAIPRKIAHVGFVIKPKLQPRLDGPAELDVAYDGAAPVHVVTNERGIVATAGEFPTGGGVAELEAMVTEKALDKSWALKIAALPAGLNLDDIDDVLLLLNFEYS
jgi:cell division septum initiation protein DivIVA